MITIKGLIDSGNFKRVRHCGLKFDCLRCAWCIFWLDEWCHLHPPKKGDTTYLPNDFCGDGIFDDEEWDEWVADEKKMCLECGRKVGATSELDKPGEICGACQDHRMELDTTQDEK